MREATPHEGEPSLKITPESQIDAEKLLKFVSMYCRSRHSARMAQPFHFHYPKIPVMIADGQPVCSKCSKLLKHAIVMRVLCPLDPKPKCRKCPQNCYRPEYRDAMEVVMRYSGPRSLFRR